MAVETLLLLSGAIGAGKTSVANALSESFYFEKVSSSGFLRSLFDEDELKKGDEGRRQLQELGDQLDIETDFLWIVDPVAVNAISEHPLVNRWMVDAVRKQKQVDHFRNYFGTSVRHIHLTAPEDVLRARHADRPGDYDAAIIHPNEVNARNLESVADLVIDTSSSKSSLIAAQILKNGRVRNA